MVEGELVVSDFVVGNVVELPPCQSDFVDSPRPVGLVEDVSSSQGLDGLVCDEIIDVVFVRHGQT